jgi:hypothetical protein
VAHDVRAPSTLGGRGATAQGSPRQVAGAFREFRLPFGARLRGVLVQPMAAAGPELLVGLTRDACAGRR